jgi:hypothetical protein
MGFAYLYPARFGFIFLATLLLTPAVFADPVSRSPSAAHAATNAQKLAQRIAAGEMFLAGLFDPALDLLPEFSGSQVYWLFHDNYLAAKLLARPRPDLTQRITAALVRHGVTNSGKIEILFDEARDPLPFRQYNLTNVAVVSGKTIRTEVVTEKALKDWEEYADLLFLAAIARAESKPQDAKHAFDRAVAMWDERGFSDQATRYNGLYATYKLALFLIAADELHISTPFSSDALGRLLLLQNKAGGWVTDYDKDGRPRGLANVETTCMALLALHRSKP